jgi:NIPSNAP
VAPASQEVENDMPVVEAMIGLCASTLSDMYMPRAYAPVPPHPPPTPKSEERTMFFELRQYRTKPGQREKWVKFMEEEIIPFQVAKGMVILGSFVGQEEDDLYVWIRRFESEEERKRQYEAVYESDHWKNVIAPQVPMMIDREAIKVTRLEATPKSVIQ